MTGRECRTAVEHALECGYRHIDTAESYDNEDAVGEAIANSSVRRDEIFLVSKVHPRNLAYEDVLRSVEGSLDRLGTTIDLLLIHAPSRTVPISESIEAMNQLQRDGVDHIGVSDFSVDQMREAMDASETPILANQVKYNPFYKRRELLEFGIENDVMVTAYRPLARGRVVGDETLRTIGNRYGKTEAQVALRWLIQQDVVSAIPKATTPHHREENVDIFDFELTDEEMAEIFDLQPGILFRLRTLLSR